MSFVLQFMDIVITMFPLVLHLQLLFVSFGFTTHGYCNSYVPFGFTFIAAVYVLWFYHSRLMYVSHGFRIHGSNVCVPWF